MMKSLLNINEFKKELKESAFYKDMWHSATPDLIHISGSILYGYTNYSSDLDINVWVSKDNFKWFYGHCWHELLMYKDKKVEWYYTPINIEEIIDSNEDISKYNFTLSSLAFLGLVWQLTDELIIEQFSEEGKKFVKRLKTKTLKKKLLKFSATHLYKRLAYYKPINWVEEFYKYLPPKQFYRIMLVFYNFLELPINTELIYALKDEQNFEQYLPEIINIYKQIQSKIK